MSRSKYEREAERLSKLPRAERFAELIDFPARHMFKLIGKRTGLSQAVRRALNALGYPNVILVERPSAKGKYASLTFELSVSTADRLDLIYAELEKVPNLSVLL